ncbi:DUF2634 domain-containing protein [Peribacillus castrilensis]|uniref:DUF2634 domain-containing protein n=1 Tax=Peribacillus castrilensis TaxID=2897690 RepID=UPI003D2BEBAB
MIAPKLTNGDLVIENGDLIFVKDDEELAQSVESVLQTEKGEFFLEEDHGLIRDNLVGKQANQDEARDDIIEAISQESRVESITEIVFVDDKKTRKRSVKLSIQKVDGTLLDIREVALNAQ